MGNAVPYKRRAALWLEACEKGFCPESIAVLAQALDLVVVPDVPVVPPLKMRSVNRPRWLHAVILDAAQLALLRVGLVDGTNQTKPEFGFSARRLSTLVRPPGKNAPSEQTIAGWRLTAEYRDAVKRLSAPGRKHRLPPRTEIESMVQRTRN